MSRFEKRIQSKIRINALEKMFIASIEVFIDTNEELTKDEVNSVLLKMLTYHNEQKLRNEL